MATVEHCLYCFETLSATLEKRTPMSLYQVQDSWAAYPKGLDGEDEEPDEFNSPTGPSVESLKARNPTLQRLTPTSSTPSSSSSSSLEVPTTSSTAQTTPSGSTEKFRPVGIGRRTSQRASDISESPLFVTWNTISTYAEKGLRGCIGTFETLPIATGLSSYAITSALQDHRFNPISSSELPSLEVSVTLLTDFEDARDAMDWEIGTHGLRISFYAKNRRFGACYLPDVCVEQGWTKEECLVSLMRKAGWNGKKDRWREFGDMKVVRFQGRCESLGWEEFKDWREWVDAGGK